MLPNTLLEMQEVANAPWAQGNEDSRLNYIDQVKQQEKDMNEYDKEPPKLNMSAEEYATYLANLKEELRLAKNENANKPEGLNHVQSFAPDNMQRNITLDPMQYDNGLVFHDFEYVGYQPNNQSMMTEKQFRTVNSTSRFQDQIRTIKNTGSSPRVKVQRSPRIQRDASGNHPGGGTPGYRTSKLSPTTLPLITNLRMEKPPKHPTFSRKKLTMVDMRPPRSTHKRNV